MCIYLLSLNNYKENDSKALRGEKYMQNSSSFLNDCSITLIDKKDGWDPTRREEYWRKVLKTVASYGLDTLN